MKTTQIALTLGLALASNLAAAQANINVAVNVTVPPCTVALADSTAMSFQMDAAAVAAAPDAANFGMYHMGRLIKPWAEVGLRDNTINVNCSVPQRVMMKFADNANDFNSGAHMTYVMKKGGQAGEGAFVGAYEINFNGKPTVDGVPRDVVYRWAAQFSDWRAPIFNAFANETYEYAFADAGSLVPRAISSASIPVTVRVALSKAKIAEAAVGGVIPPLSGSTTITVSSF
jgi:hypothetical protein